MEDESVHDFISYKSSDSLNKLSNCSVPLDFEIKNTPIFQILQHGTVFSICGSFKYESN